MEKKKPPIKLVVTAEVINEKVECTFQYDYVSNSFYDLYVLYSVLAKKLAKMADELTPTKQY